MGDPFDGLPRGIRTWLDAFSARVDGVATNELQLLGVMRAGVPADAARTAATARAEDLARRTSRTEALTAIHEVALDYISRRFSQRFADPRQPFLGGGEIALQSRGDERARLARSFEDALVAIALSDVLAPDDVDALLGRWAELADAAAVR